METWIRLGLGSRIYMIASRICGFLYYFVMLHIHVFPRPFRHSTRAAHNIPSTPTSTSFSAMPAASKAMKATQATTAMKRPAAPPPMKAMKKPAAEVEFTIGMQGPRGGRLWGFTLLVTASTSILCLKAAVFEFTGVEAVPSWVLRRGAMLLQDGYDLAHYGIVADDEIDFAMP
jgi:hypothetical protein